MRPVPQIAVDFISGKEACRLKAYPDPGSKDGNPWTVGYGHTGPEVVEGYRVTKARALLDLADDLRDAARAIYRKIGDVVDELTEHQYAALLSFVFNLGTGNPKKREWAIWGLLRKRHFDQVPGQMILFVNNDGKKMQGLVNRRTEEIKLWSTEEPGSVDADPPSSVTRSTPTPPTPVDPTPPQRDPGVIGTAVAAVSTGATAAVTQAPEMIKQGIAVVEPYADKSETVQNIISTMATVASILALIALAIVLWKKFHARSH